MQNRKRFFGIAAGAGIFSCRLWGRGASGGGGAKSTGGGGASATLKGSTLLAFPDVSSLDTTDTFYKEGKYTRWGYIDASGKWAVPPVYSAVLPAGKGDLLVVGKQNPNDKKMLYGLVDREGKEVVAPKYPRLAAVDGYYIFMENNLYGTLNAKGEVAIPATFASLTAFSQGLAVARVKDAYGFIDNAGKWAIPAGFYMADSFGPEGLAAAGMKGADGKAKYGLIGKDGKWVVENTFDFLLSAGEGLWRATTGGKSGFIDKNGKWVVEAKYPVVTRFSEGFAGAKGENGLWGFLDKTGKWVKEPQYKGVLPFNGLGIAAGEKADGKQEWFGKDMQRLAPLADTSASEALAAMNQQSSQVMWVATAEGKIGLMNGKKEMVIPLEKPSYVTGYNDLMAAHLQVSDALQRAAITLVGRTKLYDYTGKEIPVEKAPAAK